MIRKEAGGSAGSSLPVTRVLSTTSILAPRTSTVLILGTGLQPRRRREGSGRGEVDWRIRARAAARLYRRQFAWRDNPLVLGHSFSPSSIYSLTSHVLLIQATRVGECFTCQFIFRLSHRHQNPSLSLFTFLSAHIFSFLLHTVATMHLFLTVTFFALAQSTLAQLNASTMCVPAPVTFSLLRSR